MVALPSSNGHSKTDTDTLAREYIESLKRGEHPVRPDVGKWAGACEVLEFVAGDANAVQNTLKASGIHKKFPELKALLDTSLARPGASIPRLEVVSSNELYPPLPSGIVLDSSIARDGCPLLDEYAAYSRKASPRGYDDFHENSFLFDISTIAGRRIAIPFSRRQYTPLMIALVAETTLYVKTYTAEGASDTLEAAGLRWMLGDDETTPQRLITDMRGVLPSDYGNLPGFRQEEIKQALAMSAQKGWYYDEMGDLIRDISKGTGIMANFKTFLLRVDSCRPTYSYSTQKRGREVIEKPYLALMGAMTPADMLISGKSGGELWRNGMWARISFVCPPVGTYSNARIPRQEVLIPSHIPEEFRRWHDRLGVPHAYVDPVNDEKNPEKVIDYRISRDELSEQVCVFGSGVFDAFERYDMALREMLAKMQKPDFNGSYGRLPFKAMRVAALFASLGTMSSQPVIEMRHWAKAQEIAERWRVSLHELYRQVNTTFTGETYAAKIEEVIVEKLRDRTQKGETSMSATKLHDYLPKFSRMELEEEMKKLVRVGVLKATKTAHTMKYELVGLSPVPPAQDEEQIEDLELEEIVL